MTPSPSQPATACNLEPLSRSLMGLDLGHTPLPSREEPYEEERFHSRFTASLLSGAYYRLGIVGEPLGVWPF